MLNLKQNPNNSVYAEPWITQNLVEIQNCECSLSIQFKTDLSKGSWYLHGSLYQ